MQHRWQAAALRLSAAALPLSGPLCAQHGGAAAQVLVDAAAAQRPGYHLWLQHLVHGMLQLVRCPLLYPQLLTLRCLACCCAGQQCLQCPASQGCCGARAAAVSLQSHCMTLSSIRHLMWVQCSATAVPAPPPAAPVAAPPPPVQPTVPLLLPQPLPLLLLSR